MAPRRPGEVDSVMGPTVLRAARRETRSHRPARPGRCGICGFQPATPMRRAPLAANGDGDPRARGLAIRRVGASTPAAQRLRGLPPARWMQTGLSRRIAKCPAPPGLLTLNVRSTGVGWVLLALSGAWPSKLWPPAESGVAGV